MLSAVLDVDRVVKDAFPGESALQWEILERSPSKNNVDTMKDFMAKL